MRADSLFWSIISFTSTLILGMIIGGMVVMAEAQPGPTPTVLPAEPGPVLPADRDYWRMSDGTFVAYNTLPDTKMIAVRTCVLDESVDTFRLLCEGWAVRMDLRTWRWLKHRVNKTMDKKWR